MAPRDFSFELLMNNNIVKAGSCLRLAVLLLIAALLCVVLFSGRLGLGNFSSRSVVETLDSPVGVSAAESYRFFLDGREFKPWVHSLYGDPSRLQPGDVVLIEWMPLTLGEPGVYRFRRSPSDYRKTFCQRGDDPEVVVGVTLQPSHFVGEQEVFSDPLGALSAAEIRGLWGIRVAEWSDVVIDQLEGIDPRRTCLSLSEGV